MLRWRRIQRYVLMMAALLIVVCTVFTIMLTRQTIQLQQDVSEIKALLSMQGAPQQQPQQPQQANIEGMEFDIGDNPVLGKESARLILVEFTDYQCPFCGRHARETFPRLREQYIDKGQIRYAVIDQPLQNMHPDAAKAAEASHCAEDQGKFWEIHEEMMAKQDDLKDLSSYAKTLALNVGQFEDCLNKGKYGDAVKKDMQLADTLGINGVPGFILGTVAKNNPRKVTAISMINGAVPFGDFQREIEAALKR